MASAEDDTYDVEEESEYDDSETDYSDLDLGWDDLIDDLEGLDDAEDSSYE